MNRAYSILDVKSVDNDARVIRGVATTPSVDRVGDIIDPLGVKFQNPLAFLWQHNHEDPVGTCEFGTPTAKGIPFTATIVHPDSVESVSLKDLLQRAWDSFKTGLVRAVSIGFAPTEYSYMEGGGIRFLECEVFELSAVTIPANADAVITAIKSLDHDLRVAAGVPEPDVPLQPDTAATGKSVRVVRLDDPARDRAPPFVIRRIVRT